MELGVAATWALLQMTFLVQENPVGQNLASLSGMFLSRPFWSSRAVAPSVRWSSFFPSSSLWFLWTVWGRCPGKKWTQVPLGLDATGMSPAGLGDV